MKKFLAVYIGTQAAMSQWNKLSDDERRAREARGMTEWAEWVKQHEASIVEQGSPLGKTKRVAPEGTSDIKNVMAAYVVVRAESHEAAAKLFVNHPHFTTFPGDSVEIMEQIDIPR
jgi:hypothetical protein